MDKKRNALARVASLGDEANRLLEPDLVMNKIILIASEMGVELSADELSALKKHAEASRAIFLVTMLANDEERANKIMQLSDAIFEYTDDVSAQLMSAATATLQ